MTREDSRKMINEELGEEVERKISAIDDHGQAMIDVIYRMDDGTFWRVTYERHPSDGIQWDILEEPTRMMAQQRMITEYVPVPL